jgi:hypothetical protein
MTNRIATSSTSRATSTALCLKAGIAKRRRAAVWSTVAGSKTDEPAIACSDTNSV